MAVEAVVEQLQQLLVVLVTNYTLMVRKKAHTVFVSAMNKESQPAKTVH